MDDINKSIIINLRNDQYYADSRAWYLRKYIYPVVERSVMTIILILFSMALVISFIVTYDLFPTSSTIPIVIKMSDINDYKPVIAGVGIEGEPANITIVKRLVADYVVWRESYDYNNLNEQMTRIKNSSSKYIYKLFNKFMGFDNPDSPVLIFQNNIVRNIDIKSVTYSDADQSVIVKFVATDKDLQTGDKQASTWLANVFYDMGDINLIMEKKAQLDFIVTDYHVQEVR